MTLSLLHYYRFVTGWIRKAREEAWSSGGQDQTAIRVSRLRLLDVDPPRELDGTEDLLGCRAFGLNDHGIRRHKKLHIAGTYVTYANGDRDTVIRLFNEDIGFEQQLALGG